MPPLFEFHRETLSLKKYLRGIPNVRVIGTLIGSAA